MLFTQIPQLLIFYLKSTLPLHLRANCRQMPLTSEHVSVLFFNILFMYLFGYARF